ncbi:FG-GAP-like repeat-containing protein [Catellatospora methionotrophica]|uniref:FG-GAP-like repeat-containing protein n=1 Tax=Catellatospora methionotrophica TaxID=121620 RepID=UPI0033CCD890
MELAGTLRRHGRVQPRAQADEADEKGSLMLKSAYRRVGLAAVALALIQAGAVAPASAVPDAGGGPPVTVTGQAEEISNHTPFGVADWNGDGRSDVLARQDTTGELWMTPGPGTRTPLTAARVKVGSRWGGFTPYGVIDWDGDGRLDVVARQDSTQDLWLYPGAGATIDTGGPRTALGSGWGDYTPFGVGDWDNDAKTDVVVRQDTTGDLWLYPGAGGRGPLAAARVRLGTRWQGFTPFGLARWGTDSSVDVLARRDATGELWAYPGSGARSAIWAPPVKLGTGWGGYTSFAAANWDGDGFTDVIVRRNSNGDLWTYPGTAAAAPISETPVKIGIRWGARTLTITADNQVAEFIDAIAEPNSAVTIAGHVNLDLSGYKDLLIAPGVHIMGDRSVHPTGPRIYTSSVPTYLFDIGGEQEGPSDNVRISGIRFDGGGGNQPIRSVGISIRSSVNVEVDNNEFYGWGGAAVEVKDPWNDRIGLANASAVRVHGNYFHDNQMPNQLPTGYGIVVSNGGYALIDKNVFYNNRHSIAGDGSPGSGYLLYRSLILANNGVNEDEQQIDMHARNNCGDGHYNCGPAGEYMDIRYNSVQHVKGRSFFVRGRPSMRADVAYNVFALSEFAALRQNEGDMKVWDNKFSHPITNDSRRCDFDDDGNLDNFLATGVTWWYQSTLQGNRWIYLNQSAKSSAEITLGDVTGDGRCDVTAAGVVYPGGKAPNRGSDVLWRKSNGTEPLVWQVSTAGQVPIVRRPDLLAGADQILGTGDFDGDGDSDVLTRDPAGKVYRVLMDDGIATHRDLLITWIGTTAAGIADFDGDGADDVLWRRPTGKLELWLSAMPMRASIPSLNNGGAAIEDSLQVRGVGDFNGDGRADILFRHLNGQVSIWLMNGGVWLAEWRPGDPDSRGAWQISSVGDFDGDRRSDILWRGVDGRLAIWFRGEPADVAYPTYNNQPGHILPSSWQIRGTADFNADGRSDILWDYATTATTGYWTMSGATMTGEYLPGSNGNSVWAIQGLMPLKREPLVPAPGDSRPTVPVVIGGTRTQAAQDLAAAGLTVKGYTDRVDGTCNDIGLIYHSVPSAGERVAPGTPVQLYVNVAPAPPATCK